MTKEELIRLWEDPAHWRGGLYRCAQDPRAVVPKPVPWSGWTVNFAHPTKAWLEILTSVIIAIGPVAGLVLAGVHDLRWALVVIGLSIAVLIGRAYVLSGRTHPQAVPGVIAAVLVVTVPMAWLCTQGVSTPIYLGALVLIIGGLWLVARLGRQRR